MNNSAPSEPGTGSSRSNNHNLAISWQQFTSRFQTEEDCVTELSRHLYPPSGARCSHCHSAHLEKRHHGRILRCRSCQQLTWLTSQSFFRGIRSVKP
jgi:hypothetical protein